MPSPPTSPARSRGELGLIEERGAARVVVLGGAGGHFCAGLDLHWLRSLGSLPSDGGASARPQRLPIGRSRHRAVSAAGRGRDPGHRRGVRPRPRPRVRHAPGRSRGDVHLRLRPDGAGTRRRLDLHPAPAPRAGSRAALPHGRRDDERPARLRPRSGGRSAGRGRVRRGGRRGREIHRRRRRPRACARSSAWSAGEELGALEQALAAEGAAQIQALQSPEFHRRLEAFVSR